MLLCSRRHFWKLFRPVAPKQVMVSMHLLLLPFGKCVDIASTMMNWCCHFSSRTVECCSLSFSLALTHIFCRDFGVHWSCRFILSVESVHLVVEHFRYRLREAHRFACKTFVADAVLFVSLLPTTAALRCVLPFPISTHSALPLGSSALNMSSDSLLRKRSAMVDVLPVRTERSP